MDKKIFALMGIFVIVMIGCAYAADSADSSNSTVTISGINFTIPEGLTENVGEEKINESGSEEGYNYLTNQKTFVSGDYILEISVSSYEQNMSDDYLNDTGKEATINNVAGRIENLGFLVLFSYVQDGKVVVITSNDKSVIEKVLA